MLPRAQRLTSTLDFSRVVRHGARFSSPRLVLHIASPIPASTETAESPARFGFVVSKLVGSAPRRNRVRRQLREIARSTSGAISGDVVIRALPAAADATWEQLTADVALCLGKFHDARL